MIDERGDDSNRRGVGDVSVNEKKTVDGRGRMEKIKCTQRRSKTVLYKILRLRRSLARDPIAEV